MTAANSQEKIAENINGNSNGNFEIPIRKKNINEKAGHLPLIFLFKITLMFKDKSIDG